MDIVKIADFVGKLPNYVPGFGIKWYAESDRTIPYSYNVDFASVSNVNILAAIERNVTHSVTRVVQINLTLANNRLYYDLIC